MHILSRSLLVLSILFGAQANASWEDEADHFANVALKELRATRSHLKRHQPSFALTVEVLNLLEDGKRDYGAERIIASKAFPELLIDLCDIVNLQSPDFKGRYDVLVEQWGEGEQKPFSLFTFDKIAQAFYFRETLFKDEESSNYRKMLKCILLQDLPALRRRFILIRDLATFKAGDIVDNHSNLGKLSRQLDELTLVHGEAEDKLSKTIRQAQPLFDVRRLRMLTAMAHDYLTLERIEQAVEPMLAIGVVDSPEKKEAFLAGMIQVGELSTNKHLSSFMRQQMPTIPWGALVRCRDAIEHQDENGFNVIFEGMIAGTDATVDFNQWQNEMGVLQTTVSTKRGEIWGVNPKAKFEQWIEAELEARPQYGVIVVATSAAIPENRGAFTVRKYFRQSRTFLKHERLWGQLISGEGNIQYEDLEDIRSDIAYYRFTFAKDKTAEDEKQERKILASLEHVEQYLWNRLRDEATHLDAPQSDLLSQTAKDYFGEPLIAEMCIALLKKDQAYLTEENREKFKKQATEKKLTQTRINKILKLFKIFKPQMNQTRVLATRFKEDKTKDLPQAERRALALEMFTKTSERLHDLAHTGDFNLGPVLVYYLSLPPLFASEQAGITDLGVAIEFSMHVNNKDQFMGYAKQKMKDFYREAHKVVLSDAIRDNPIHYLSSVYTISVGYGALKGWVEKEANPPAREVAAIESIREGRNFIAHGDLFRIMHGINLAEVQEAILTDHLDFCEMVALPPAAGGAT